MTLLFDFISSILLQISEIYLFKKLSNKKLDFKLKYIFVMCLLSIVQITLNMNQMTILSNIIIIFYFIYLYKFLFHCSEKVSRTYTIIIWIVSIILDLIMMLFMSILPFSELENIEIYKSFFSILMSIILFVIASTDIIIKFLNKIYKRINKLHIANHHIYYVMSIYFFVGILASNNLGNSVLVVLIFILSILVVLLAILWIALKYQKYVYKNTIEILEKNNEINYKVIEKYRILKHNLESQLLGLKTVANKATKDLINNMILEYNKNAYIEKDFYKMPSGINGLIYEKLIEYKNKEINISVNNKIKKSLLKTLGARRYNLLCESLGVTLNNALQATIKSKEKIIFIEMKEDKDHIIIKIINTFSGTIELEKLGTKNYSTKVNGHGLGLYSLIGRKNIKIVTSIKNNYFVSLITINKKRILE